MAKTIIRRPQFAMNVGLCRVMTMNERQWELLCSIQDMLGGILQNMDRDEFHAPAPWLLENLWHSIEAIKGMESN
jgi:hypothetical protein